MIVDLIHQGMDLIPSHALADAAGQQHSQLLRTAREKTERQAREALDRTREKGPGLEAETQARCQAMLEQAGQAEGPEEEAE